MWARTLKPGSSNLAASSLPASPLRKAGKSGARAIRIMDIKVKDKDGTPLGGIEVKSGSGRYRNDQRSKDEWLRQHEDYPVDLVRKP